MVALASAYTRYLTDLLSSHSPSKGGSFVVSLLVGYWGVLPWLSNSDFLFPCVLLEEAWGSANQIGRN